MWRSSKVAVQPGATSSRSIAWPTVVTSQPSRTTSGRGVRTRQGNSGPGPCRSVGSGRTTTILPSSLSHRSRCRYASRALPAYREEGARRGSRVVRPQRMQTAVAVRSDQHDHDPRITPCLSRPSLTAAIALSGLGCRSPKRHRMAERGTPDTLVPPRPYRPYDRAAFSGGHGRRRNRVRSPVHDDIRPARLPPGLSPRGPAIRCPTQGPAPGVAGGATMDRVGTGGAPALPHQPKRRRTCAARSWSSGWARSRKRRYSRSAASRSPIIS